MSESVLSSLRSLFPITDEQAMWRVQMQDDTEAFALLVRRWEQPIQRLCARMTGDVHRAEDLAQEAFAKLFMRRKSYQAKGRFSTFLWRVALNLCYDELRRVRRRAESSLDFEDDDPLGPAGPFEDRDPAPDTTLMKHEQAELIRGALLQLSETHRSVLIMRHYEQLKFREIAEVLEIPEGTVKSRMAEALAQLSQRLNASFKGKELDVCKHPTKRIEENLVL